jgi:hypothetical protein
MRFEFMHFHYSCRNLVVANITHRKIAFRNVHGNLVGRRKHLLSLCKYVTMFKLLLSFCFFIDATDTNISAARWFVVMLLDSAFKYPDGTVQILVRSCRYTVPLLLEHVRAVTTLWFYRSYRFIVAITHPKMLLLAGSTVLVTKYWV